MNEIVTEIAVNAMRLAKAPPLMLEAVRRLLPKVLTFAKSAIDRGADPNAEFDLMMTAAEEQARAVAREKFKKR